MKEKTRLVAFEDSRNGNYEFRYFSWRCGGPKGWGPPIWTEPIAAQGVARPGGGASILARVAGFF